MFPMVDIIIHLKNILIILIILIMAISPSAKTVYNNEVKYKYDNVSQLY